MDAALLNDWSDSADRHPVWLRADGPVDGSRGRIAQLVGYLASVRGDALAALAGDPWQDVGFAARMTDWVGRLLEYLPADVTFTADEASRLVAVPFLHDALWSGLAAQAKSVGPHELTRAPDATGERAEFERFVHSYPRLYRRAVASAEAGRPEAVAQIGWWLLHRWVARRPAAYQPGSVAGLLTPGLGTAPAGTALCGMEPERLAELLRALRAGPEFLARTDRPGALTGRDRMVGYLLAAARALAVETVGLPEVIVEHLGIADPVSLPELRASIVDARWLCRAGALVLDAACHHPAVEVALNVHVSALNRLLTDAQRSAGAEAPLRALAHLPTHVSTERLQPANSNGSAAYASAGVRFRLAEDRVQELLMGEQLYGDPALAVRELYQNALDACRYREARTEFLRRTADGSSDRAGGWRGRIRFEQGTDSAGRPYLDCADNGVGMGVRELSEVFSQAGVRLADLSDFVEEQAQWARLDPPVRLFMNSRFGIGVLSYFMLADEITVDTCRLGRDGRPGERLRVSIAGPGNLFRILRLGPGTEAGTTVRLHLRSDSAGTSCTEILRKVLWVADFDTEATHGAQRLTWRPGELSEAAPVGVDGDQRRTGEQRPAVVAAPGWPVWWCAGSGAILADGLWAGQSNACAVVNLSRDLAPQLSVDRTRILSYRDEDIDGLLRGAVPAVSASGSTVLSFDWLCSLTVSRPRIADLVLDAAVAAGHRQWKLDGDTIDLAVAGCFPPDRGFVSGSAELAQWRLTALAAAGRYRDVLTPAEDWRRVVRAQPSDALLVSLDLDGAAPWLDPASSVPLVHLLRMAQRTGRTVGEVAARLEILGYTVGVGQTTIDTIVVDPDDTVLTSRDLDGARPWLDPEEPVRLVHLLRASEQLDRGVVEIADRLAAIGYTIGVDLNAVVASRLDASDLVLISADLDAIRPWLDASAPVSALHLLRAAQRTGRSVADLAARLIVLGYTVSLDWPRLNQIKIDDLTLLSVNLDATSPWLDASEPVPVPHLLRAAELLDRRVGEVSARLTLLGYPVGVPVETLETLVVDRIGPEDLVLASADLDGRRPWLDASDPVPLPHLVRAAEQAGGGVAEVSARLIVLGYRVVLDAAVLHQVVSDDLALVSIDFDGASPWLDPGEPVPLAHIVGAARNTGRPAGEVVTRLAALGYPIPAGPDLLAAVDQISPDDLVLASRDLDRKRPWLPVDVPVPLPHLVRAAHRSRRTVREVAARLGAFGYSIGADEFALGSIDATGFDADDLLLSSKDLDGRAAWLDADEPVPLAHLLKAAQRTRRSVAEVAARLTAIGYAVPDLQLRLPRARPGGV